MTTITLPGITPLPFIDRTQPPAVVRPQVDDYFGNRLPVFTGQLNALSAAIAQLGNDIVVMRDQTLSYRNEAGYLANEVAAGHAAAAALSAGSAATERGLAAAEHAGAVQARQQAEIARDSARTFAEAAGAEVGIAPSLAAMPLANLRINAAGNALEATYSAPAGDMARKALSAAATLQITDKGALVDCSGTWALGFASAATLGAGWWCYARNTGAGMISIIPASGVLIDGLPNFVMYPNECRLIQCDGSALRSVVIVPMRLVLRSSTDFYKPPGYKAWDFDVRGSTGGGASGGSGRRASSVSLRAGSGGGGGGGGVGGRWCARIPNALIPTTLPIIVGAKGVGGASVSTPTGSEANGINGNPGTVGGTTSVTIDGRVFSVAGGARGESGIQGLEPFGGSFGGGGLGSTPSVTGTQAEAKYAYRATTNPSGGNGGAGALSDYGSATPAPGGTAGANATDSLGGTSGAGGAGGPSVKNLTSPSVSVAGQDGEAATFIIEGVL